MIVPSGRFKAMISFSALHRVGCLVWLCLGCWVFLLGVLGVPALGCGVLGVGFGGFACLPALAVMMNACRGSRIAFRLCLPCLGLGISCPFGVSAFARVGLLVGGVGLCLPALL